MTLEGFHEKINSVFGWLIVHAETEMLFRYARESKNAIVEIGSYEGKSTSCLALGSQAGSHVPIYAVDPHKGSPDILGLLAVTEIDSYSTFISNMERLELLDVVRPIRKTSVEASKDFNQPVGLLFVDGRHEYEFVKQDIESWTPKVVDGGIIIFHDCWAEEVTGVSRAVNELLKTGNFEKVETVGTSAVVKKIGTAAPSLGKTAKLLLGGLMLGDTFHIIPFFNRLLQEGVTKIYWITGNYERTAVEFLEAFYPIEARFFSDDSPTDFSARRRFSQNFGREFDSIDADIPIRDIEQSLCSGSFEPDLNLYTLHNIHLLDGPAEESVILHPQTVHYWKKVPGIESANWQSLGKPIFTVGHSTEVLVPNTSDFRGRSFFDVAKKIKASQLVVGIHSAIACLTMYLDKRMIVCHPWKDPSKSAFLHFNNFKSQMKDVYQPAPEEILDLASRYLNNEDIPSAS